jgi:hypothetical protein
MAVRSIDLSKEMEGNESERLELVGSQPDDWEDIDPYKIFSLMFFKMALAEALKLPASYGRIKSWDKFSETQKKKIIALWNGLPLGLKSEALKRLKQPEVIVIGEDVMGGNWNKNDWARLIHIFEDSKLSSVITKLNTVSKFIIFNFIIFNCMTDNICNSLKLELNWMINAVMKLEPLNCWLQLSTTMSYIRTKIQHIIW